MNQINAAIPKADTASQSTARIEGALSFIAPQDEKPVFHSSALTGSVPKIFFENEQHVVPIGDMREIADDLSVDREGFELLRHRTQVSDLYDDDAVENEYNPEIEALLKERFNADQVVVFDVTRRSDGGDGAANPDGLRGPARRVHADYTEKSGPQRVRDILGKPRRNGCSTPARISSRSMSGARSRARSSVRRSRSSTRPACSPATSSPPIRFSPTESAKFITSPFRQTSAGISHRK